jgi:hypothetical protein
MHSTTVIKKSEYFFKNLDANQKRLPFYDHDTVHSGTTFALKKKKVKISSQNLTQTKRGYHFATTSLYTAVQRSPLKKKVKISSQNLTQTKRGYHFTTTSLYTAVQRSP